MSGIVQKLQRLRQVCLVRHQSYMPISLFSSFTFYESYVGVVIIIFFSLISVGRMFHSATRLNNHAVLIYGGRTSPSKPCIDTVLLSPMATETSSPHVRNATCGYSSDIDFTCGEHFPRNDIAKESYKQTVLHCHGDIPEPRWRHTASCIVLSDGRFSSLVFF